MSNKRTEDGGQWVGYKEHWSGTRSASSALIDVLDRIEDYLEQRQDVRDGSDGVQLPNEAMSLLTDLAVARTEWARETFARSERTVVKSEAGCPTCGALPELPSSSDKKQAVPMGGQHSVPGPHLQYSRVTNEQDVEPLAYLLTGKQGFKSVQRVKPPADSEWEVTPLFARSSTANVVPDDGGEPTPETDAFEKILYGRQESFKPEEIRECLAFARTLERRHRISLRMRSARTVVERNDIRWAIQHLGLDDALLKRTPYLQPAEMVQHIMEVAETRAADRSKT